MVTLREDIPNLLIDGTRAQMDGLRCPECGAPIRYRYTAGCDAFTVLCDCTEDRCHGTFHEPNCVQLFGPEHTF